MEKNSLKTKYFGDRRFYAMVLGIAVPIMIQNGITNFVSMLDNIMIGRIGTEQMSGAAIVNQLIFVYNLCIFGAVSGVGIFTAQYFGQKDSEGIHRTFRFKLYMAAVLTAVSISIFLIGGKNLVQLYLQGEGSAESIAATCTYALQYLRIILFGLPPFMIVSVYASTLRECGETVVPMKAGIVAVFFNLVFNWILIYGMLGFPAFGVAGAAIATVISRYVELFVILFWTHRHLAQIPFLKGIFAEWKIPGYLAWKYFYKSLPLLINETLWAGSMAVLAQCYSVRGLHVVAGLNISNTIANVFNIVFVALGDAVAIIVGQLLGAGKMKEAKDTDNKLIAFSVCSCVGVALVMFLIAPIFPKIYNTNSDVQKLARGFITVTSLFLPVNAFINSCYFTLRSGGKTVVTFLFDSVFVWIVSVPLAFILSHFTGIHVLRIYLLVNSADLIKACIGLVLVRKNVWMENIVSDHSESSKSVKKTEK